VVNHKSVCPPPLPNWFLFSHLPALPIITFKEHLSALVFNKKVSVEYSKIDKYGRAVGKIVVDGVDANLEQIRAGMA